MTPVVFRLSPEAALWASRTASDPAADAWALRNGYATPDELRALCLRECLPGEEPAASEYAEAVLAAVRGAVEGAP